ncbi:hypothetical protein B0H15DRAFT_618421 [Mycena belliarum]|uniref:RNase III domain-containing protein n=1 Tax=Mycena belliarum TaxID=1033014 RepID=A0AAD6XYN8_9AGAR|nr:hypothetical protein B0H15DRAFT_618421 [Mycena belliae]
MAPRIHEIQAHVIASIHGPTYRPIQPPTKTVIFSISRKERERLEIYGDALLGCRLIKYLFFEFPLEGACFISNVKAALLSNHIFTNILLKAKGYSTPLGFPVDKAVADVFETMAALSHEEEAQNFELWFCKTFIPLVNAAASLRNRADIGSRGNEVNFIPRATASLSDSLGFLLEMGSAQVPIKPKTSRMGSCIEVAVSAAAPISVIYPLCVTKSDIPIRRRGREDESQNQPLPRKRRWAEAMEAVGHQHGPSQSNWVEAMTRIADPTQTLSKQGRRTEAKENQRPPVRAESHRYRRWNIFDPKSIGHQHSTFPVSPGPRFLQIAPPAISTPQLPSAAERILSGSAPATAQAAEHLSSALSPTSPIQQPDIGFERDPLEPFIIKNSMRLPPPDAKAMTDHRDEDCSRAGTCSPMEMSPNCSPTRFIWAFLPSGDTRHSPSTLEMELGDVDASATVLCPSRMVVEPIPTVLHIASNLARRRSDSLASTSSSPMDISPSSSPTKFLLPPFVFSQEPTPTLRKQGPPDSPTPRGHTGMSDGLHLPSNRCPLTSAQNLPGVAFAKESWSRF